MNLPHTRCFARLRPSPIHGIGVFAIRDIPAGTNIFSDDSSEMEWVDAKDVARTSGEIRRLYHDFCVRQVGKYGGPKGFNNLTVSWYLNEPTPGNAPNVVCRGDFDFFAARDIEAGEELTVDYSTYSENQS
jgi:SET domain-containing protein